MPIVGNKEVLDHLTVAQKGQKKTPVQAIEMGVIASEDESRWMPPRSRALGSGEHGRGGPLD
jgi:hypothetical protein